MTADAAAFRKRMLEQLDGSERLIVMLYHGEELTPGEIGQILGMDEPLVQEKLAEIVARARKLLAARGTST